MGGCVARQKPPPPVPPSLRPPLPAAADFCGIPATDEACHHEQQEQRRSLTGSSATPVQQSHASYNGGGGGSFGGASSSRNSSLKKLHYINNTGSSIINNNNNNSTPPPPPAKCSQLVAMFDYVARIEGEVTFCAGDSMYLLEPVDPDWWYVEHKKTGVCGYVPVALIAHGDSLQSKSWFAGTLPRKDAERQLLRIGNQRGTFLVRESETSSESYSLSVLDHDAVTGRDVVKHYRIRLLDDGRCYITSQRIFGSIRALVDNYSAQPDGLCCQLARPCPRPVPTVADLSYETRDRWEIPRDQIRLVEQLGSGQFGEVWRGLFNGRHPVAVKMLKAGSMSRADFLKEARIMKRLRHPKLVQLFAVCTGEDPVYIVTELMSHGALLNYLRQASPSQLDFVALLDILGQVARGMAYLEAEKFIHRDLAARNILVGENNSIKVADFGLSRAIGDSDAGEYTARQGAKFPIKWTSPEAALLGRFSIKSDVWSFGIVIYEVATRGQQPYPGMSNTETLTAIQGGYRMPQPAECPAELYDLMLSCWQERPELRPAFARLRRQFDDFFDECPAAAAVAAVTVTASTVKRFSGSAGIVAVDDDDELEAEARIV